MIDDARNIEPFASMQATIDNNIGCYIGVPLVMSTGAVYGTLCAVDPVVHHFTSKEQELLVLLARLVAFQIEHAQFASELRTQYRIADEARSQSRAVLDATAEVILLVAPDSHILSANRQSTVLFGIPPETLIGMTVKELRPYVEKIFADPEQLLARFVGAAQDTQREFTVQLTQKWPRQRQLHLHSSPVTGDSGAFLGRIYVLRDVTEEREIDRAKTEFVSLVSHELRTPLTSIKGYVDLLLEGDVGEIGEEQREFLEIVKNNADRLISLISDMLDISRIEAGRVELEMRPCDIRTIIDDTALSLRTQFIAKQQRLHISAARNLPPVCGDAGRLIQIMTNLLSNASKYTPDHGEIVCDAQVDGTNVRVNVRDNGIGLSAEEQSKLFTKFFRARNRLTRDIAGSGLGLAIVRSLVQLLGGDISVESAPGQGSTFSFTIPALQDHPA